MRQQILCVVDARQHPEKSFLTKNILREAALSSFEECKFLFILPNDSAKYFLQPDEQFVISEEKKTLEDFLDLVKEAAGETQKILFTENDMFPHTEFFKQLLHLETNQVLLPERALVIDGQAYFSFDQKNFESEKFMNSHHFFCAGLTADTLPLWDMGQDKAVMDNLGESFFQLCRQFATKFIFANKSSVFSQAGSASYGRARGHHGKMGYYSGRTLPIEAKHISALEMLEEYSASNIPSQIPLSLDIKSDLAWAAKMDPRWQRISSALPQVYQVSVPPAFEQQVFSKICERMKGSKYVVLLHHLRRGGAEKEAILHLQAYCQLYPDRKVSLVLTLPAEPDLAWQLPDAVEIIEFAKLTAHLPNQGIKNYLLFRVLDFIKPEIIHNKCSGEGWQVFESYGKQLALNSNLWGSLYCIDYSSQGIAGSYAFQYLFKAAEHLSALFLDNDFFLEQLRRMVPLKSSCKLFYPVSGGDKQWSARQNSGPLKMLWCARLCFQKDISTLIGAAWLFPEIEFHVYGEISEVDKKIDALKKLENVKLWGAFDGIEHIDIHQYDAFLYTTFWDGLPNVVLEVGALGMPVISPRVCGIREILRPENSFLYDDLSELSEILENWRDHSKKSQNRARELEKDIRQKHSWGQFLEKCREIYA